MTLERDRTSSTRQQRGGPSPQAISGVHPLAALLDTDAERLLNELSSP